MFLNFNMYFNISETSTGICLKLERYMDIWKKCRSSFITLYCILTKLCPFLSLLILFTINTRRVRSINSIQMFTPTGQLAEPILPLYQLCQGHWWGYESHSAIVVVVIVVVFVVVVVNLVQTFICIFIRLHLDNNHTLSGKSLCYKTDNRSVA